MLKNLSDDDETDAVAKLKTILEDTDKAKHILTKKAPPGATHHYLKAKTSLRGLFVPFSRFVGFMSHHHGTTMTKGNNVELEELVRELEKKTDAMAEFIDEINRHFKHKAGKQTGIEWLKEQVKEAGGFWSRNMQYLPDDVRHWYTDYYYKAQRIEGLEIYSTDRLAELAARYIATLDLVEQATQGTNTVEGLMDRVVMLLFGVNSLQPADIFTDNGARVSTLASFLIPKYYEGDFLGKPDSARDKGIPADRQERLIYYLTETDENISQRWTKKLVNERRDMWMSIWKQKIAALTTQYPDDFDPSTVKKEFKPPKVKYPFRPDRDVREGLPEWPRTIDIYDPRAFGEYFGLAGLWFGKWESSEAATAKNVGAEKWKKEKIAFMEYMWDGLHDLAYVLNIPPKSIGMGQWLVLDFGAQGKGGRVAAHFVPSNPNARIPGQAGGHVPGSSDQIDSQNNSINLTRTVGAGSFAHEWAHALDWFMSWYATSTYGHTEHHEIKMFIKDKKPQYVEYDVPVLANAFMHLFLHKFDPVEIRKYIYAAAKNTYLSNPDKPIEETVQYVIDAVLSGEEGKYGIDREKTDPETGLTVAAPGNYALFYLDGIWSDPKIQYLVDGDYKNMKQFDSDFFSDAKLSGPPKYWASPLELFARAFEAYVQDKLGPNRRTEQVAGTYSREGFVSPDTGYKSWAYPRGDERKAFAKAFDVMLESIDFANLTWDGLLKWTPDAVFNNAYHWAYLDDMLALKESLDAKEIAKEIQEDNFGYKEMYWYWSPAMRNKAAQAPGYFMFSDERGGRPPGATSFHNYRVYGYEEPLDGETMKKYNMRPYRMADEAQFDKEFKRLYDWTKAIEHGQRPEDSLEDEPPAIGPIPKRTRKAGSRSRPDEEDGSQGDGDDDTQGLPPGGRAPDRDPTLPPDPDGDPDADAAPTDGTVRPARYNHEITPQADPVVQSYNKRKGRLDGAWHKALIDAVAVLKRARGKPLTPDEKNVVAMTEGVADIRGIHKKSEGLELAKSMGYAVSELGGLADEGRHGRPVSMWVYRAMWDIAKKAGFAGGRIFIPNVGVGRIIGSMPSDIEKQSAVYGHTTSLMDAEIAQALYAKTFIEYGDLLKAPHANEWFDLVMVVTKFDDDFIDVAKENARMIDEAYRKLRPGGIAVVVMNNNPEESLLINRESRYRSGAKKGQIHHPRKSYYHRMEYAGHAFILSEPAPDRDEPSRITLLRKEYAEAPPILWDSAVTEHMRFFDEDMPKDLKLFRDRDEESNVRRVLDQLPIIERNERVANAVNHFHRTYVTREKIAADEAAKRIPPQDLIPGVEKHEYTIQDGKLLRRVDDRLEVITKKDAKDRQPELIRSVIPVKDALKQVYRTQVADSTPEKRAAARAKLNKEYDAFVKKHGYLHRLIHQMEDFFIDADPWADQLLGIEEWDEETKQATKRPIFEEDVVSFETEPTTVSSAREALDASLGWRSKVDLEWMESISGLPLEQLLQELAGEIYFDPLTENWVGKHEYLSGDVLSKLHIAQAAMNNDPRMAVNVRALTKMLPTPKSVDARTLIPKFGAPYVPVALTRRFLAQLSGVNGRAIEITQRVDGDGSMTYKVTGPTYANAAVTQTWGTPHLNLFEIVTKTLNGMMAIPTKDDDFYEWKRGRGGVRERGKFLQNAFDEASLRSLDVQKKIQDEFQKWVRNDEEAAKDLEHAYNNGPNRFVLRDWEAESKHLKLHGASTHFMQGGGLREVQRIAITRAIQDSTYLVHQTGYGKTYSLIGAAIEAKRRGFVKKGLLVVQSDKLKEITEQDIRRLYPTAKVMAITMTNPFQGKQKSSEAIKAKENAIKRYVKQINRIRDFDGDLIVTTHTSLDALRTSVSAEVAWLEAERRKLREDEVERRDHLNKLIQAVKRAGEIEGQTFETLGIDWLGVDEADEFKNIPLSSALGKGVQGLKINDSNRAQNFYDLARFVIRSKGRVVLASATPVPNSPSEIYAIQRTLNPEALQAAGIHSLDDWLRHYARVENQLIMGQSLVPENKLSIVSFDNIGSMYAMAYQNMDTYAKEGIVLPEAEEPVHVKAVPDDHQRKAIRATADKILRGEGVTVAHITILQGLATDARMYDKDAPRNPQGKIDLTADIVAKNYHEMSHFKGVTVVFADRMRAPSGPNKGFHVLNELKRVLVEDHGLPKDEIWVWPETPKAQEDIKQEQVRQGRVRVVLASTKKGGTGVNYQDRVGAMIHLDQDWTAKNYLQRVGRGIRPGNIVTMDYGWKVRQYNIVAEDTIESYMFGVILQKAAILNLTTSGTGHLIDQLPISDPEGGEALYFKHLQKLAGNSELLNEIMELQPKVTQLKAAIDAWETNATRWKRYINSADSIIARADKEIEDAPKRANRLRNVTAIEFEYHDGTDKAKMSKPPSGDGKSKLNVTWNKFWESLIHEAKTKGLDAYAGERGYTARVIGEARSPNGDFTIEVRPEIVRSMHEDDLKDVVVKLSDFAGVQLLLSVRLDGQRYLLKADGTWKGRLEALAKIKDKIVRDAIKDKEETEKLVADYEAALDKGPPNTEEYQKAYDRLQEIKGEIKNSKDDTGVAPEVGRAMYFPMTEPDGSWGAGAPQDVNQLDAQIQDIASRIAPGLKANVVETVGEDPDATGYYLDGMAQIAMAAAHRAPYVLRHEAIHYLLDKGLILPHEWSHLKQIAKRNGWIDKYNIRERYPEFFDEQGNPTEEAYEEAVAYAYAEWAQLNDQFRGLVGTGLRVFQRIRRLLYRLANRFDGDPTPLFESIERGTIGRRAAGPAKPATKGRSMRLPPGYTPDDPAGPGEWMRSQKLVDVDREVIALRDRIAPGLKVRRVPRVEWDGVLEPRRITGSYWKGLVQLTFVAYSEVPLLFRHEAVHYLKDRGLFSDQEWTDLKRGVDRYNWMERYRIPKRYPHYFSADGTPTERAYEEAIAEAYREWAQERRLLSGSEGVILRVFHRIAELIYLLGNRLQKLNFADPDSIFELIESGEIGARTGARYTSWYKGESRANTQQEPRGRVAEPPITYEDEALEDKWQKRSESILGTGSAGLAQRIRERSAQTYDSFQRVHKHLPREPQFQQALEWFRHLNAGPSVAAEEAGTHIRKLVEGLDAGQRDLLGRAVFLRDFAEDLRLGIKEIPFFPDLNKFRHELGRIEDELQKEEHFEIRRRLALRHEYTRQIAERMVDVGLLPLEALNRRGYIMHQVIKYQREIAKMKPGTGTRLRTPRWAKRAGTFEDISVNLIEVEAAWMLKALVDIRIMETLEKFRDSPYNKREELLDKSRNHNERLIESQIIAEWRKHDPASFDPTDDTPVFEQFIWMLAAKNAPKKPKKKRLHPRILKYRKDVEAGKRKWIDHEKSQAMVFTWELWNFRAELGKAFAMLRADIAKARDPDLREEFDSVAFRNPNDADARWDDFNQFFPPDPEPGADVPQDANWHEGDPEWQAEMDSWTPWDMLRFLANEIHVRPKPVIKDGKFVMEELSEAQDIAHNMSRHAQRVFGLVYQRQAFYKKQLDKWIHGNDMEEVLAKLKEAGVGGLDGYRTWQPDSGRILYTVRTLPERVADVVVEHVGDVAEAWAKHVHEKLNDDPNAARPPAWIKDRQMIQMVQRQLRSSLAIGGPRYQMVLPEEIADTLDNYRDSELEGILDTWATWFTSAWKKWVLINPAGVFLYNFRNLSGDLDHVVANFGPRFKEFKPTFVDSIKELYAVQYKGAQQGSTYQAARALGVIDSGFALNEVLDQQREFDDVIPKLDVAGQGWQMAKKAWREMAKATGFRENIMRYMVFQHVLEYIDRKGWWSLQDEEVTPARIKQMIKDLGGLAGLDHDALMQIGDWLELAAHISRETLGDYGNISQSGKFVRSTLYPFFSWKEINLRFYFRVGKNVARAYKEELAASKSHMSAARAVQNAAMGTSMRLLYKTAWLYGLLEIFKLLFSAWEDELPESAKREQHITLWAGPDNVYALPTPGALGDLLETFGFSEIRETFNNVRLGRGSLLDLPFDIGGGLTNTIAQGFTPAIKVPAELLTGLSFWPNAWEPRSIRDMTYHVLQQARLDTFADIGGAMLNLGRPNLGPLAPLAKWAFRVYPKEYAAYSRVRSLAYAYKDQVGEGAGRSIGLSERARVMWYWRLAKRFGDTDAERRYFEEMKRLKVTKSGMQRMIMGQHPIGMLSNAEKRTFLQQLTPKEKDDYRRAVTYWRNVYR